jgi:hypothetical protein
MYKWPRTKIIPQFCFSRHTDDHRDIDNGSGSSIGNNIRRRTQVHGSPVRITRTRPNKRFIAQPIQQEIGRQL